MSNPLEILCLDEAATTIQAPQSGTDTYLAPVSLTDATGNEVAFDIQYTTNKATSGNDTGLVVNQTDTASPGTSLLADFQVGGTSKFNVNNSGDLEVGGIIHGGGSLKIRGGPTVDDIYIATTGNVSFGTTTVTAQVYIRQPAGGGAEPVLGLEQSDTDEPFINFIGTASANATDSISTLTTSGAVTHHIQVEINGTTAWIPCSTNAPS